MRRLLAAMLLAALLFADLPGPAAAAGGIDLAKSAREAQARGALDDAIRLYDQAIAAGDLSAENQAVVRNNQGIAYWSKGEIDKALAAYDEAIRLEPDYAEAYHNRGMAHASRDETAQAIADYDAAIRLDPEDAFAFENRGRARLHVGQVAGAIDDLSHAVSLAPEDAYAVLWLHLARTFAGQDDAIEFSGNAGKLDRGAWPGPVIDLYLGLARPEKVRIAAVAAKDSGTLRTQSCEADFYIGAYDLLHGARADARRLLQEATVRCAPSSVEYGAAKSQLKRLPP